MQEEINRNDYPHEKPCPVCGIMAIKNWAEYFGLYPGYYSITCNQCGDYIFRNEDLIEQTYDVKKLTSFLAGNKATKFLYILTDDEKSDINIFNKMLEKYERETDLAVKPCILKPEDVEDRHSLHSTPKDKF